MTKKSTVKRTKPENGFDRLARLIKSEGDDIRSEMREGFAKIDGRFVKVDEQFVETQAELRAIRHELADINRRLDRLEEDVDAMRGYSKEIDELRTRVRNIEKHPRLAKAAR